MNKLKEVQVTLWLTHFFSGYKTKHNDEHLMNTAVVKMLGKHFHVEFINEAPNGNIQIDLLFEERRGGFYYKSLTKSGTKHYVTPW